MNIIIPMAGMGKRMRPHTLVTAKPLLPIAGKPIVQRLLEDIIATSNQEVEEVAFIIAPHFGKATEEMLLSVAASQNAIGRICYQHEALGTAHAILCAADNLKGNVFIAFADTLFKADFKIDKEKDAIIWTHRVENPSQFGVVKLAEDGHITDFIEKPETFVSDLAIIGIYYFKDGVGLRAELQYLIDNNLQEKGEFQLTNAMENMKNKGVVFYSDQVKEWLDCGNKDATIYTNQRILEIKNNTEKLQSDTAVLINSLIIPPCFIGSNVEIKNSIIGPHVSLENGVKIENSILKNSIIQEQTIVKDAHIEDSMLGKYVIYHNHTEELNLGDYSKII